MITASLDRGSLFSFADGFPVPHRPLESVLLHFPGQLLKTLMHKTFLAAIVLAVVVVAITFPAPIVLMSCGLLGSVMTASYLLMNAALEPRARPHPENTATFRTFAIGALVTVLVSYGMVIPVALHVLTGAVLFVGFALMACTTGFICGWVACAMHLGQSVGLAQRD